MSILKKKKTIKRHGGGGFIFSTLSFIVICAALVFGMSVFFRVSNIEVIGADHYTIKEITEASGIKDGDNLMFVNREAIENRLYKKLIYIGTVKVNRKLPNTVVIKVNENETVARIETDSGSWLIDKSCRLLEECTSQVSELYITVKGVSAVKPQKGSTMSVSEEDVPKEEYLSGILTAMSDRDMISNVKSVDISNVSNVEFEYLDRFTVKLGKNVNLDYKFELLLAAVSKLESSDTGTIDLSQDKKAQFSPY